MLKRSPLVEGLKAMGPVLQHIAEAGEGMGIEAGVLAHLRPGLLAHAKELAALA